MSRTRYHFDDHSYPYFMTCTINGWLPVFTRPETRDIILDSWRYLQREKGMLLFGYVILENHLHWIARCGDIVQEVRKFKSYTARQIIDLLKQRNARTLLDQLHFRKARHKKDSDYQLWQEGSHPQEIQNEPILVQKLEYAHYNPVKRGYVDDPVHWRYSSARNYAGQDGLIDVFKEWHM